MDEEGRATLLLLVVVVLGSCVAGAWDVSEHLGTRTPYPAAAAPPPAPAGCKLLHVNAVYRHGARYPTAASCSNFTALQGFLAYGQHVLPGYEWILQWESPYNDVVEGLLCGRGQLELYGLGSRFSKSYISPTNIGATANQLIMQCTYKPRTGQSGVSFSLGMMQNMGDLTSCGLPAFSLYSETKKYDKTLRFWDACDRYQQQVQRTNAGSVQANKYAAAHLPVVVTTVEKKTGLTNLNINLVSTMFDLCRYDVVIYNTTSRWCSLFSPSDVEVFEVIEDLNKYYAHGYGIPIAYQDATNLLQEIVAIMEDVAYDRTESDYHDDVAKLRFAHAETVLPLLALLGLYKDPFVLSANTPTQQLAQRVRTKTNRGVPLPGCRCGELRQ
eukprot:TRINITY_DN8090_c0_g1_i2.p1 TRINITY_DN8090_c0_g1~~TRINITY_DN8090_c0_g1_i2.p1  ORF type:complete len:400 (+),score=75.31 TRINITY_DN8090_c0_g1_i2:46-1200(+)